MENNIQLFEHEEFGEVRVVTIDGEPWFVATDVCRILELGNTTEALRRLDEDELTSVKLKSGGQMREMKLVNEPGLYRLVFASRKKEARKFQRWVYHEVLPSIRKTGSYSLKKNDRDPLAVERNRLAFEQKKFNVENSENAIIFKTVNQLIELATLAGDEKYIRSKLVSLATNLLVRDKFIDESDIIFKK